MASLSHLLCGLVLFYSLQSGLRTLSFNDYWQEIDPNYGLSHLDPVDETQADTIIGCGLFSLTRNVTAFGYRASQRRCHLYNVDYYNCHIWLLDPGFQFFLRNEDHVYWDGWQLVFRAQRDIGTSVYSTWMDDGIYHDGLLSSLKPGCLSINTSQPCDTHYKSEVVTKWDMSGTQRVRVLLLKDSLIRQEITFDGTGTSKTSWFSSDRVNSSTWTDLTSATFNFFSIEGDPSTRRFFINAFYAGCNEDYSWMTVVDGSDHSHSCSWDNPSSIPKFMYTTKDRSTKTDNLADFEFGDVMAILVK